MKALLTLIIFALGIASPAWSQSKNSAQIKTVQEKDFQVSEKNNAHAVLKNTKALYKLLATATTEALNAKAAPAQSFFNEAVTAASYTYKEDASLMVNEHLFELNKKYPVQMKKAIESLPKDKRTLLENDLRALEIEANSGNG